MASGRLQGRTRDFPPTGARRGPESGTEGPSGTEGNSHSETPSPADGSPRAGTRGPERWWRWRFFFFWRLFGFFLGTGVTGVTMTKQRKQLHFFFKENTFVVPLVPKGPQLPPKPDL